MHGFNKEQSRTPVSTLLTALKDRPLPIVQEKVGLEEVPRAMVRGEPSHQLYVVNESGHLSGSISLETVHCIFSRSYEPLTLHRELLYLATAQTTADLMRRTPESTTENEKVGTLLKRMSESNVNEMVVVDKERRVVGYLTLTDLLRVRVNLIGE